VGEAPFGLVSAGCAVAHTGGIISQLFLKVKSFLQKNKNIFDFYKKITETLRIYLQIILQKSKT